MEELVGVVIDLIIQGVIAPPSEQLSIKLIELYLSDLSILSNLAYGPKPI